MLKTIFIATAIVVLAATGLNMYNKASSQVEISAEVVDAFKLWKSQYSKMYSTEADHSYRLKVFAANYQKVKEHNAGNHTSTMTINNKFADLTKDEFKAQYTGYRMDLAQQKRLFEKSKKPLKMDLSSVEVPSSFDWRPHGAVNAIKDQAQCGSCWAFSSVANIEGAAVVQAGKSLKSLSEEELVDCSNSDDGCQGGLQPRAFQDMLDGNFGLELEADYPYTAGGGVAGSCQKSASKQVQFINDYTSIGESDEEIMAALIKYGPLAIALDATPMQLYQGGIDDPWDCSQTQIDHAVAIVGFGEENGVKFWIIRNSWGTIWGEDGYYRLVRGRNACGMNGYVVTAIINS